MSENQEKTLQWHLEEYRKKFYVNKVLRGSLVLLLIFSSIILIALLGEGILGFPAGVRTFLFFSLLAGLLTVLGVNVLWPVAQLMRFSKGLNELDIAQLIRKHFPEINDKLLNLIQLKNGVHPDNSLAIAAIQKKTNDLAPVPFAKAINLNLNLRYARFLLIPVGLFLLFAIVSPALLKNASFRLLNFRQEFKKPPPFFIDIVNHPDKLISGTSFKLETKIKGDELPGELYLYLKKDSEGNFINYPMSKTAADEFQFEFSDLKENFEYYVGNQETSSDILKTEVLKRPGITNIIR